MEIGERYIEEFGSIKVEIKTLREGVDEIKSLLKEFTVKFEEKFDLTREEMHDIIDRIKTLERKESVREDRTRFFKDGVWKIPAFILGSSALLGVIFDFLYRLPTR